MSPSEAGWRARRNEFAGLAAVIAKAMWLVAPEVVGVAGMQHRRLLADGHLETPTQDDAAFLAFVRQCVPARSGTRLVALLEELNRLAGKRSTYLPIRDAAVGNLGQFVRPEEDPVVRSERVGEEVRQWQRHTVEDFLEHADRRIQLAGFNLRDGRVGDTGELRQLPLGEAMCLAHRPQALPDILVHDLPLVLFTKLNILAVHSKENNRLGNAIKRVV